MRQDSFGLMTQTNPNSPLATNRFRTILFGTTCSPFILYATLLKHLNINVSDLTETLKNGLYVDNVLTSFPDENDLLRFYE